MHTQEILNVVSDNNDSSSPDTSFHSLGDEEMYSARDRLLQKLSVAGDLPALGASVSRVVQLASSDDEAVRRLAHFILSDVALTQTILRISNTVAYRSYSGTPVTTVSKAILILGFNTIKTSALAMLLVDRMSGKQAQSVRMELVQALSASIIARELSRGSQYKDGEEAAVAALFKNIGRVLVAAHQHELYSRIMKLIDDGSHTPRQASMEVLGCSFELLGKSVLQGWKIPEIIVQALPEPSFGMLRPAKGRQDWLQQVASFGAEAAALLPQLGGEGQEPAIRALLKRFGTALNLDRKKFAELLVTAAQEIRVLADNTSIAPELAALAVCPDADEDDEAGDQGLPSELLLDCPDDTVQLQVTTRHASGKPMNARDLLLAGMQDVTQMMASGSCKVNDLMLLVLETLYSSLGFRFATVCLKDAQSGQFRARISMGENGVARQAGFVFSATSAHDLFHLALQNDADLMIADATAPKVRDLLPAWHRTLLPDARSFIVLPLVVNQRQIGLFYADRRQPAPEGVPPDETALIKTLKGQVLTALNTR
jgi:HD-like signal output (HDOD) protein